MPGLLDDFISALKGDKAATARAAGHAARYAQYVDPAAQKLMIEGFWPWFEQVSARIPSTWYHPSVQRKCDYADHFKGCSAKAVGMCRVCRKDVCLSHAFIGLDASLVCLSCVLEAAKHVAVKENDPPRWEDHSPPPPKPKEDIGEAYRILGVEEGCEKEELDRAYKKLLAKWHPDRVKTPEKKKQYEAKFKQVRSAYDAIEKARKT